MRCWCSNDTSCDICCDKRRGPVRYGQQLVKLPSTDATAAVKKQTAQRAPSTPWIAAERTCNGAGSHTEGHKGQGDGLAGHGCDGFALLRGKDANEGSKGVQVRLEVVNEVVNITLYAFYSPRNPQWAL